jgi:hypothetical protein
LSFLFSGMAGLYFLSTAYDDSALQSAKVGGLASLVFTAIVISEVAASKNTLTPQNLFGMLLSCCSRFWPITWLTGKQSTHHRNLTNPNRYLEASLGKPLSAVWVHSP